MHIKKENIKNYSLFLSFALAFGGYYATLILLSNLLGGVSSRSFTIPIRVSIIFLLFIAYVLQPKIRVQKGLMFFLLFAGAYLFRILIEYFDHSSVFHISEIDFFLYFVSFVFVPIILLSQTSLSKKNYDLILKGLLVGILSLSVLTLYFYNDILGNVARISLAVKRGEEYISPLALSYCSALGMGLGISYLLTNHVSFNGKFFIFSVVGLSCIPFFLGSSRGSIFALSFPFAVYFFYVEGVKRRASIILAIIALTFLFVILTEYLGSSVFERFFNIYNSIETGDSSSARIEIWKAGLMQFWKNPLFGNSLNCELIDHYPHNILIEVLITTGIVGFVPFFLFLWEINKGIKGIIKIHPQYFWVCVVFLQSFMQNMFSGGLYAAGWFAIGGGLILGFRHKRSA